MNLMQIWKKDTMGIPGNDPAAVINMNTASAVVDFWIQCLTDNPGSFDIELQCVFNFGEKCSSTLHEAMGVMLLTYERLEGKVTSEQVIVSMWAVLQGFSITSERSERLKEKEENNFDDQFLHGYEG